MENKNNLFSELVLTFIKACVRLKNSRPRITEVIRYINDEYPNANGNIEKGINDNT